MGILCVSVCVCACVCTLFSILNEAIHLGLLI